MMTWQIFCSSVTVLWTVDGLTALNGLTDEDAEVLWQKPACFVERENHFFQTMKQLRILDMSVIIPVVDNWDDFQNLFPEMAPYCRRNGIEGHFGGFSELVRIRFGLCEGVSFY